MERILDQLKANPHRSTTKKTYHKVWEKFNKFVIKLDRIPKKWEQRLSLYIGYVIKYKRLKSTTVKSYISAIKSVLLSDGYQWNNNLFLLDSVIKTCKMENDILKVRLPIGKNLLEIILFQLQRDLAKKNQPYLEILYITAFLLFYYGMLRVGELAKGPHSLKAKNVHSSNTKNKILLMLYSSKTHSQADRPQSIKIQDLDVMEVLADKRLTATRRLLAQTNFCPFLWVNRYLRIRGNYIHPDEEFMIYSDGSPVPPANFRRILRQTLENLRLKSSYYDIHSFRIGRATDLQKGGVDVEIIKKLGRWRSNSVYRYLRDS